MNSKDLKILSGNSIILAWIVLIVLLTAASAVKISTMTANFNNNGNDITASWNESTEGVENATHTNVLTGVYLNGIPKLSLRDSTFNMDFYIWFRWRGDNVSPGQNFEIVNGAIDKKELQAEWNSSGEHYEQYHVFSTITKYFDVQSFPLDKQKVLVEIEDALNSNNELSYIPDTSKDCNMSSQVTIPGYDIKWISPISRIHNYETSFATPWTNTNASTYSQLVFGANLSHSGWGLYFKLAQAFFISVFVAIICAFLKPNHSPRFNVGIGALFANVASYYFVLSIQPPVSYLTMADIICLISIITIFLTLVQSCISYYMYHNSILKNSYRKFDIYSAITFAICYIFINSWIVRSSTVGLT